MTKATKGKKPKKLPKQPKDPRGTKVDLNDVQVATLAQAYGLAVALDQERDRAWKHLGDLCGVLAGNDYTLVPIDGGESFELYRKP